MSTFYDQIPTFRKIVCFFTHIFTWRRIRRFLLVSVSLSTLYAIYCTEEDWRGRRAWEAYVKELEAQGMPVTEAEADKLAPVPVPDEQNFWSAPYLKQLAAEPYFPMLEKLKHDFSWSKIAGKKPQWGKVYSDLHWDLPLISDLYEGDYDGTSDFVDVSAWKKALDQPDLVGAFNQFNPQLSEIADACERPFVRPPSRYPGNMGNNLDLEFWSSEDWDLGEVYELRGLAELDADQVDRAADDAVLLLGSYDTVTGWRIFNPRNGLQLLWQGIMMHRWTDSQLTAMQSALQKVDYFPVLEQNYLRGTAAYIDWMKGYMTDSAGLAVRIQRYSPSQKRSYWWCRFEVALYPNGAIIQKCLDDLQDYEGLLASFDLKSRKLDGVKLNTQWMRFIKSHPEIKEHGLTISNIFTIDKSLIDDLFKQNVNQIRFLDLAVVACALERYRLANGQLPEKLGDIAPKFLTKVPVDIINGGPLHYQRLEGGRYLLYAIGIDGIDHGGVPGLDLSRDHLDSKTDLVWPGLPKAK